MAAAAGSGSRSSPVLTAAAKRALKKKKKKNGTEPFQAESFHQQFAKSRKRFGISVANAELKANVCIKILFESLIKGS